MKNQSKICSILVAAIALITTSYSHIASATPKVGDQVKYEFYKDDGTLDHTENYITTAYDSAQDMFNVQSTTSAGQISVYTITGTEMRDAEKNSLALLSNCVAYGGTLTTVTTSTGKAIPSCSIKGGAEVFSAANVPILYISEYFSVDAQGRQAGLRMKILDFSFAP